MSASVTANAAPGAGVGPVPANETDQFCTKFDILELRNAAIELVQRQLKPEQIRLEVATDPEGAGEWLVLHADVRASVDEVLDRYAACKRAWIGLAPSAKRGLVRFLYNIL